MSRAAARGAPLLLALSGFAPACDGAQVRPEDPASLAFPAPRVVDAVLPPVKRTPAFGDLHFQRALDAQQAPGDSRSWYVVEQRGFVLRVLPGIQGFVAVPFLDLVDRTCRTGNEEGLLGLAFSPHFAEKGHPHEGAFYVNYSVRPGPLSRLSRIFVRPGQSAADPASEQVLLEVEQPFRNHNGGALLFGPDGKLYWSLGDGGLANDPHGNGQNLGTLLGKILRLDVEPRDDGRPYGVPADNPFVGRAGARPEIWAYGLRNAWRIAFDGTTGELWAGDVGQDRWEYVTVIQRGGNHGWNLVEGLHRFRLAADAPVPPGLIAPVWEYAHQSVASDAQIAAQDVGLSITGGFVYRGQACPGLQGWYLCADYVTQHLWAIRRAPPDPDGRPVVERALLLPEAGLVSSFAQGHDGELLLIDHLSAGPTVWRLVPDRGAGSK
jgi:glucose/arabinose dehydrogenase